MHKKAIEVDAHLRVKGAPVGEVYAIGDASTVSSQPSRPLDIGLTTRYSIRLRPQLLLTYWNLWTSRTRIRTERLTSRSGKSWVRPFCLFLVCWTILTGSKLVNRIKQRIPMAESQLDKVRELFELYDSDGDNSLTLNELAVLLQEIGNKITALPAVRL